MLNRLMQAILKESARLADPNVVSLELLEAAWPELVGRDLATRTRPQDWRGSTLYIAVSSMPWMQELSYRQDELLSRIARLFPWKIERLHLSVVEPFEPLAERDALETVAFDRPRAAARPAQPLDAAGARQAARDLEALDEDTRAMLLRIKQHIHDAQDS